MNIISQKDDIDKIYLYAKDLSEPKHEFLIKKCEDARIKHLNDQKAFTECSNTMDDVYEDFNDYNHTRKIKILIAFDNMIANMSNKKIQDIVKELFIRCSKLNISLLFITQSYFSVPKDVRLNSTHYLILKINKRELQNNAINHSANIDYNDFVKIYKKPFSFLTTDTLPGK